MQQWKRWVLWLTPPYGSGIRRKQILDDVHQWQEEERAEAVRLRLPGVAEILSQPRRQS